MSQGEATFQKETTISIVLDFAIANFKSVLQLDTGYCLSIDDLSSDHLPLIMEFDSKLSFRQSTVLTTELIDQNIISKKESITLGTVTVS